MLDRIKVRVTLWLTPEAKRDLKVVAAATGMTMSEWVTAQAAMKRSELQ